MRKPLKVVISSILFTLYGFLLGLYVVNAFKSIPLSPVPSEGQNYHSVILSDLYSHTAQEGNSVTAVSYTPPAPVLKKFFSGYSVSVKTIDHHFGNVFLQYFFFSKNRLLRSRLSDIIFPFHYFW